MGKVLKWIGIGFVIIIALAIIGSLGGNKDTTQPATSQPAQSRQEQKPVESKKPDLEVIEAKAEKGEFGNVYIVGVVKNNTKKQYSYVQVEINLYDKNGNQLGSTLDNVNNLEPGGTWRFKAPVLEARKILKHFSGLDSTLIMAELIRIYKVQMDKHPLPDRVSGMLWFDQGQPIIVTNENHPYVRRRFTAFHELGHLILGHRGVRLCVDLFGSDKLLERHANQFAAEILMPRGIINWYLRRGANIKRIAQELCVSEEAVAYRIRDLTI